MSSDEDDEGMVGHALDQLGRPARAGWTAPAELKRTATRRKRAKFTALGAGGLAVATALTLAVALPRHGSSGTPTAAARDGARIGAATQLVAQVKPLATTSGSADERAVVTSEQAFTFALLKQVNAGGGTPNIVLSPSSLALALAMLQNGSGGKTRQEITDVLHTSALTDQQTDSGWAALTADLSASGVLDSANSLWLQRGAPMGQPFMDAMARYFRTGVWQVDFAGNLTGANKAINAWVADQTHGKITKLFNPGDIDASTLLVLANAIYFKAAWQTEFDPKATKPAPFHKADGRIVSVPFMNTASGQPVELAVTPDAQAVQLPYTGKRYAALAIMPTTQPLARYVDTLTPSVLAVLTSRLQTEKDTSISLPKFTLQRYTNLSESLSAMGMPTAFTPDGADLYPMSVKAGNVQSVVQRAYLKVDEKGTEAAAATGIGIAIAVSSRIPVGVFDHPFLFLVRDTKTGAIVFSAQVQDPSA